MNRFTTLLLIFSALLVLVAATPVPTEVAPATRTVSLEAMLARIRVEVKQAGTNITGTGLTALKKYSTAITGIITPKIGSCIQNRECRSTTSPAAITNALAGILIEIQTKVDEIIGALGASTMLQMFLLPLITELLAVLDLVLDTLGNEAIFDALLGLLDFGSLGNILGLIGLLGGGRQA